MIYCVQNHDQVGNRALGTRLSHDVGPDALLGAAVLMLFLPASPLVFMGQEWAASTPFLFFADHHGELGAAVTRGRREEFKRFAAFADEERAKKIPDPQAESTFLASKLDWAELLSPAHARAFAIHRAMFRLCVMNFGDAPIEPFVPAGQPSGKLDRLVATFDGPRSGSDAILIDDETIPKLGAAVYAFR
jgi:1,4-alpha-glucan branching enzyme